jgi:hypothetical protein
MRRRASQAVQKHRNKHSINLTCSSSVTLGSNPTADPPGSAEWTQELEFFTKLDRYLGTLVNQTVMDEENEQHMMYQDVPCKDADRRWRLNNERSGQVHRKA